LKRVETFGVRNLQEALAVISGAEPGPADFAVRLRAGTSTIKLRFRCAASDNSDSIFLDDVTLSAP
jgi:hypothetical protein